MRNKVDNVYDSRIKDFLLKKGLINEKKIKEIEEYVSKSDSGFERALIEQGVFSSDRFLAIKSEMFNLPSVDISEKKIDHQILNLLSSKVAKNYQMVIFDKQGSEIYVGFVNPGNFNAYEAIEFLVQQDKLTPKYFVILLSDFERAVMQYDDYKKEIGSALEMAKEKFIQKEEREVDTSENLAKVIKTAPVAKIVSVIIAQAVEGGASDIHIEPGREEARIRYRVDGVLHSTLTLPKYLHQSVVSRIKVLANLKIDETRLPQDGRFKTKVNGDDIDLRVSVLPMLDAEKVVIRILDSSKGVPTLSNLGIANYHIKLMEDNIKKPHGLFLLTGPTGSGKTTTLYSVLNMLNSNDLNITTLEDPIEYYISGINQSQIRADINFTFAGGLRAILRQDPNIIMVGEIRDKETAELVIHAALTGHLVFSTLHTNDAIGAIPRLIDMGVEPFLLASTLNLVMAQRLVRKVCPKCKKEFKLPSNIQKQIDEQIKEIPDSFLQEFNGKYSFFKGVGCVDCSKTGYSGRSVVSEIIEINDNMKEIVATDFDSGVAIDELKKQDYITLEQDGIIKALKGITTIEEVLRVSRR